MTRMIQVAELDDFVYTVSKLSPDQMEEGERDALPEFSHHNDIPSSTTRIGFSDARLGSFQNNQIHSSSISLETGNDSSRVEDWDMVRTYC